MARDGAEQDGGVGHVFGERPDLVEGGCVRGQPIAADAAIGGFHPHDAAEGSRLAHAAARIRPVRAQAFVRRHRGRAAAARSARHAAQIPRIVGSEVGRVLGAGAHGELVGVGLAEEDRAGRTQLLHHGRVVRRHVVFQDPRPAVGARPSTVITSLIASGIPVSKGSSARASPRALQQGPVRFRGLLQGQLRRERQVGLDVIVDRQDAVKHGLGQLDSRDLARAQQGGGFMDGQFVQHWQITFVQLPALASSFQYRLHLEISFQVAGALASTSSLGSDGATASSRMMLRRGNTVAVGGTAEVSTPLQDSSIIQDGGKLILK